MIDNISNYKLSLLKCMLKQLLTEFDNSYGLVKCKYMNAVHKALKEVNSDDLPQGLPFNIIMFCSLLEARNNYDMPPKFLALEADLLDEIERFIN